MQIDSGGLKITSYRGGLALLGPSIDEAVQSFGITDLPSKPLHITLLNAAEFKALKKIGDTDARDVSLDRIYILGQVTNKSVRFLVVVWNHGDIWRQSRGLGRKEFHITLSDEDDHKISKGVPALLASCSREELLATAEHLGEDGMDHTTVACWGDPSLRQELSFHFVTSFTKSFKAYLRLAEFQPDPKVQMLALARAAALDPALIPRVSVKMKKLNGLISWGPVMTVTEMEAIPQDFRALLFHPFPAGLEVTDLWLTPTISRDRALYLGSEGLPRFFSWIYPNRIAGMSTPRTQADCDLLREIGFTHVLSLTEESPLPEIWFEWGMNHVFLPIPNYGAPTLQEMDLIYEKIKEGGMWLVHCGGGVGRAGTVLACLITMLGKEGIEGDTPKLDSNTAIKLLREVRPRSLESEKQEQFVAAWVSHRWKTAYLDNWIPEPCTTLRQEGESPLPEGSILFLIGKPGSGKSWLAAAISKRKPRNKTIVISQDDGGSRAACEREFGRQDGNDTLVIFDRCNPLEDDRKFWLKLTDRPCVAVYFDYPKDLCAQRINLRFGHPTIRAGRGANALDQFNREMQPPTLDEEFVAILTITSLVAARDAVRLIAKDPPLLKFPRTPHLLDLGATTDDDIVLEDFPTMTGKLTLEEKIDGANMGFSLDWDGVIRCQNRSHWVSSNDHSQFKPLDRWIEDHSDALRILLDRDVHFPERYILYGEWMVAKHSIHYTHLPGPFVAFDLYDRLTQTFLSRSVLTKALKGSGIPQVPLVAQLETITKEDVLLLLDSKSAYASGSKIEGVYIKTEDADRQRVVGRGKVVRGDFIAGNDHWTKGNLTLNGLAREEEWLDLTALQNLAL